MWMKIKCQCLVSTTNDGFIPFLNQPISWEAFSYDSYQSKFRNKLNLNQVFKLLYFKALN